MSASVLDLLTACEQCYSRPAIKAGIDGANGASVSVLPSGETLLTFSGTPTDGDFRSLIAWLGDFDFELVHADGFSGRVHRGFLTALNNLWGGVIDAIEDKPPEPPPLVMPWWKRVWKEWLASPIDPVPPPLPWHRDLTIIGHSLGGALAQMAAVRLARLRPRVICFAAPLWTDATGARNYPADVQVTLYQAENDLVPFVPPFGYEQVSEAEVVSQAFSDLSPLIRHRLALMRSHELMADLLHEGTRAATWAKVTIAHGIANYRQWLSQMPSEGQPQVEAA